MRVLVINPNSNETVTANIDRALESMRDRYHSIDCVTLDDGPYGIESDVDIAAVEPLVLGCILAEQQRYDAFVVACYSDPGVALSRDAVTQPVVGIQEAAASLCAAGRHRFGVLALAAESIERHVRYLEGLGLLSYHVGERPLGIDVETSVSGEHTTERIIAAGRELVEDAGAERLVLGCAGMLRHREAAEMALGVPVIDPVQAAVAGLLDGLPERLSRQG